MSAFEADRFNRSRTSPEGSCQSNPGFLASLGMTILKKLTTNNQRPTTNDRQLTTALKERLQQLGATACQDAAANLYFVVQLRVIQHLHYRLNRACFRIVGAID